MPRSFSSRTPAGSLRLVRALLGRGDDLEHEPSPTLHLRRARRPRRSRRPSSARARARRGRRRAPRGPGSADDSDLRRRAPRCPSRGRARAGRRSTFATAKPSERPRTTPPIAIATRERHLVGVARRIEEHEGAEHERRPRRRPRARRGWRRSLRDEEPERDAA